jgi:predicted metal-dependent phosphoesterase TrpH
MYKFDTHVHTSEVSGCAHLTAVETLKLYKEKGFDGVVITDHYNPDYFNARKHLPWEEQIAGYLKGYHNALEYGKTIGMTVFPGAELRLRDCPNEYLLFGMNVDMFINLRGMYDYSIEQVREVTKKYSIAVFQAHPFRYNMIPMTGKFIDGCEVYNGNPRHDSRNDAADEYAAKNNLHKLSGSDCHEAEDAAQGGIILNKYPASARELIDEVIAKNVRLIKNGDISYE